MAAFDPAYLVIIIILVLAILGGYYLYRNALQVNEMEDPENDDDE